MASSITKKFSSDSFHQSSSMDQTGQSIGDNVGHPVATYSASYNKFLPQLLLDQLAQMTPEKFLTYILSDLSAFQLEELLLDEKQRMKTFLANWPHSDSSSLSGVKMAQAGFYSLKDSDKVQCVFCKVRLYNWKDGEEAMTEHARTSNFCRFVKGFDCGNRPHHIGRSRQSARTAQTIESEGTTVYPLPNAFENAKVNHEYLGIVGNNLHNRKQAPTQSRLSTYKTWPGHSSITVPSLYEAGFYYTLIGDEVQCFCCGGKLKCWKDGNEPWLEHARWFPYCLFLLEVKGQTFVEEVHRTTPIGSKGEYTPQLLEPDNCSKSIETSINEEMVDLCLRLGHKQETIDKALAFNEKPFNEVKQMIDIIYKIEEGELDVELPQAPPQEAEVTEDIDEDTQNKFQMCCRMCARSDLYVTANHIGLPCGHLIFCDDCSAKAKLEAENSTVMCPYPGCKSRLLGTRKIYFG